MRPADELARIKLAELNAERWHEQRQWEQDEKRRVKQMGLPFYKRDYFYLKLSMVIGVIAYVTTMVLVLI